MLEQLKFSHKIALMPALAGLASVLILAIAIWTGRSNQLLIEQIEVAYAPAFEISRDLDDTLTALQRSLQDAVAAEEPSMLESADALAAAFRQRLAAGEQIPALRAAGLPALGNRFAAYYPLARTSAGRMMAGETGIALARDLERLRSDYQQLHQRLVALAADQRARMQEAFALAQRNQRRSLRATILVIVCCLVLLGALSAGLVHGLRRELGQAIRVADNLAEAHPATISHELPRDEIGELLVRMRHMVERVESRTAELQLEIGERQRVEEALRESEQRYALAAAGANDGLWDWDLQAGRVYYSPRWKAMLGLEPEAVSDQPSEWVDRIHELEREIFRQQLELHCAGVIPHFECEHRLRHADGTWRWMLARGAGVGPERGRCSRIAGSLTDITQRKRNEEQLIYDAFHDALTRLPNRALLLDRLSQALSVVGKRPERLFAVLFLDLDRFKVVNDSVGHLVGDELLRAVGQRLLECVRPEDTVARMGGDEFAILLSEIGSPADAVRVAERVQRRLGEPFPMARHELVTTASIGIALSATGYRRPEEVLRDADLAMYRAKALGKARHEIFDSAMHARSVARLQLEMDLRRALERGELRLFYQPVVRLADASLAGFEALLRWRHSERGLVLPDDFIAMAEETGLILPIGRWVLGEAARQMRDWQQRHEHARGLHISVNLSPRELSQDQLPERIAEALDGAGVEPHRLCLEITEGMLMDDAEGTSVLHRVKELGVQLHVDDFGTGYSSLAYLDRLPIDALKIDRSFVSRMRTESGEPEMVRTIIGLAHNLGMLVVAEGVEHREQAERLCQLSCELAQGYFFAPPLDAEAATQLLARGALAGMRAAGV